MKTRSSIAAMILLVGAAAATWAQEVSVGKFGRWQILAISEKGQFHRCTASTTDRGGMLRIHQLRSGSWTLSWPRGDMPKKSKASGGIDLGRASFKMVADADNGSRASTALDEGMVRALRGAPAVSVTLGRNRFSWVLGETVGEAMSAIGSCRDAELRKSTTPAAGMIYPDYPGASQSCVVPRGLKWTDGTPLVLDNCPRGGAKVFVRTSTGIASAAKKDLCVGVARGARTASVELQSCRGAATKWSTKATATVSARITSAEGERWAIPAIADDNARFPMTLAAVDCRGRQAKPLTFFFE